MESLKARLSSIQKELLEVYEAGGDTIEDQIKFWNLERQEKVLLHLARKQGITRIGNTAVPTLASSQQAAKAAIEMVLYLTSLKDSPYGKEKWTQRETTRERLLAPPEYCFKKTGIPVQVTFDGDRDNSVEHVSWGLIYYLDENEMWRKATGEVDHHGIFYTDDTGTKEYYVDFQKEAVRYSRTGQWDVLIGGKVLITDMPVARASSPDTTSGSPKSGRGGGEGPYSDPESEDTDGPEEAPIVYKARAPKPLTPPSVARRARSRSRSPFAGRRRGGTPQQRKHSTPRPRGGGESGAPSPQEVGKQHQTVSRRSGGRLQQLLQEARDPPALILKGSPNGLKCVRFRVKSVNASLFESISTTYYWTDSKSTARLGDARVTILFKTEHQRELFLSKAKIPRTITVTKVTLPAI
uniref:Regulatory protein E2 n=1 Tax=Tadarida brasiliensis papillomavirus TaxID=2507922 RepID=A0A481N117_9PAPI|nr:E2 [Tadarida brasiliensis papillomavirus]